VKEGTGGAGGQPPPASGVEEAMDGGKGQLVMVVGGGVAQGDGRRALTALEFQGLAAVPPEAEWFANIDNPRTRRAYQIDIREFMGFVGIAKPEEFRGVTRAHVIAWRKDLEGRELSGTTIRRKLAALSSLFEHDSRGRVCLCNTTYTAYITTACRYLKISHTSTSQTRSCDIFGLLWYSRSVPVSNRCHFW
jgi:hypothetical protein